MNYNATYVTVRVAGGLVATMLFAGCAVEVPKFALPAFRLTPPAEVTVVPKTHADDVQHRLEHHAGVAPGTP